MFKLLRHFTVMSALATAAITTVLVVSLYWYEARNLHQLAEERNAAYARNLADVLLPQYAALLEEPVSSTDEAQRAPTGFRQLDEIVRQTMRGKPILKVKIFTPAGLTVYSSDPAQVGESKANDPRFNGIVANGTSATVLSRRNVLSSFEKDFIDRNVAETYVPIRDGKGAVAIVVELYTDISVYVAELEREIATVTSMLVTALGTLFIVLLLVVRRADRILVRQYRELETFNGRLEEKVDERTRGLLNQQSVLSWITKSEEFRSGNFEIAIGNLTRITAATLGVERVSIWMYTPTREELRCVDLYCARRDDHSRGQSLVVARYPSYFQALHAQETLSIDDALNDERLLEFRRGYLQPLNIGAMLDVPIVHGGRIEGVLCIEHVGGPLKWSAEQRLFAIAIANFASLAVERQERLKVEDDLRAANRSVEGANRAKSLFLANMSHEIRTPMNGVFGMTDLLMRTELSERQRKFVAIIAGSARRLLTIINDILDLSRIESGKLELDRHDFSLRSTVEETVDLLAAEAQGKGLELSVFVAREVPAMVTGDSGRLRQIITNLVSNAIKFTSTGEVAVRVDLAEGRDGTARISFEVRDTGIGIPEDIQQRLFTPFQQADTSISRRFGGTGLGLSISRHLVELMGGRIELLSAPGKGTKISFVLEMPVKEAAAEEADSRHEERRLKGRRVLVLDDRATNREVVQSYFNDAGARVLGVASAKEAYDEMVSASLQGDPIALVVADMVMPEVNGLEFAQMVRADARLAATRLIMLTSLSWKGDARVARDLGFGAFLTKPVHRSELIRTAERQLPALEGSESVAACAPASDTGCETTSSSDHKASAGETEREIAPDAADGLDLAVLLAEDNPVNVEVACEYLTAIGCRVSTAADGREAIEAVRRSRFDIVLMDCQMPEMDGLTATRRIREIEAGSDLRHTVIIALTANAFAEDRAQCMEAGMDDYMSKPFSEQQLRELLARWAPKVKPVSSPAAAAGSAAPAAGVASGAPAVRDAALPVLGDAAVPVDAEEVAAALDLETLRRMQKSHPSLAGRLVDTYLGYAPKAIQQMLAALTAEDNKQLMTTAHSLKSSSANIGAMHLSGLCRALEARLKNATTWDAGPNLAAVADIERAFQAVAVALGGFQAEIRAAAPMAKASA
jgi:signal transduction histidine kinase/CheY-like chemotaxis protein/HPt (histidine-containing phosphotransfer) domain-containing protein